MQIKRIVKLISFELSLLKKNFKIKYEVKENNIINAKGCKKIAIKVYTVN